LLLSTVLIPTWFVFADDVFQVLNFRCIHLPVLTCKLVPVRNSSGLLVDLHFFLIHFHSEFVESLFIFLGEPVPQLCLPIHHLASRLSVKLLVKALENHIARLVPLAYKLVLVDVLSLLGRHFSSWDVSVH
jgi:hypothetical protein